MPRHPGAQLEEELKNVTSGKEVKILINEVKRPETDAQLIADQISQQLEVTVLPIGDSWPLDPSATARLGPAGGAATNELRSDFLFSYRPTPGTVLFFGYGASLTEPDAFRFQNLRRTSDGFFLKASYLFRM